MRPECQSELSAKEKIEPPRARLYGQLFADIRVYTYMCVYMNICIFVYMNICIYMYKYRVHDSIASLTISLSTNAWKEWEKSVSEPKWLEPNIRRDEDKWIVSPLFCGRFFGI